MAWKSFLNEVEFLAEYATLFEAINDNNTPLPGYLFGEINAITYIDNGQRCKPLINYLVSKIQVAMPYASIKVLKLLIYLLKNGHKDVVEEVRLHEVALKKAMGFHGPSTETHGSTHYETLRKLSKEVLEIAFSEPASFQSETISHTDSSELPGYGSSASLNKLSGFGYSIKTQKTVSDKVVDGLSNLMEKIMTPTVKIKQSDIHTAQLGEALPQYKPISIDKCSDSSILSSEDKLITSVTEVKTSSAKKHKVHKAGRPGGGWNNFDDENDLPNASQEENSKDSTISVDSLDVGGKIDLQALPEWLEEREIIDEFTVNEPLYNLQWTNISSLCKKCSSLNCDKILEFLIEKLNKEEENVQLRALLFIEYLLHRDVVHVESLTRIVLPPLQKLAKEPKNAVHLKAKKICLIINHLNNNCQHSQLKNTSSTLLKCGS